MKELLIDDKAVDFIKKALACENAQAVRLFISGGGCCKQFEITPVRKALTGDVTFEQDGIKVYIEKIISDNTELIKIKYLEIKGLVIEFE